MKNETIIVYESIYNGNTEKLARRMAMILGCRFIKADEALRTDLSSYKAIGFGSGIYFGCHHPAIFEVIKTLSNSGQEVFIFSSRGAPVLGNYHKRLRDLLIEKGKSIVGEFSVRGYDETGPWVIIGGGNRGKPDERDLKKAESFIRKWLDRYCVQDFYEQIIHRAPVREGIINTYLLNAAGKQILLKGDLVTINQNDCTGCGKCSDVCPLYVIEIKDHKASAVNELDCTLCKLCVMNCPARAINLHYSWLDAINVAKRHNKRVTL